MIRELTPAEKNRYDAIIAGMAAGREDRVLAAELTYPYLKEQSIEDAGVRPTEHFMKNTDPTVTTSIDKLVDNKIKYLLPADELWGELVPDPIPNIPSDVPDEEEPILKQAMEQVAEHMKEASITFAAHDAIEAEVILGSGALKFEWDDTDDRLTCSAVKPAAISWQKNSRGFPDTVIHKQSMPYEIAIDVFDGLKEYLEEYGDYTETPAETVPVTTYVYPEAANSIDSGFRILTMFKDTVVDEIENNSYNPYVIFSIDPYAYDQYGASPVKKLIPAIEQLYALSEALTKGAQLRAEPSYIQTGDDTTPPTPYKNGMIYKMRQGSTMQPLNYGGEILYSFENHRMLQDNVKQYLFDVEVPLDRIKGTTATAIEVRQESFLVRIASAVHNFEKMAIGPIMDTVIRILVDKEKLSDKIAIDDDNALTALISGRKVTLKVKSALQAEQDKTVAAEKMSRMSPVLELVAQFGQMDPSIINIIDFAVSYTHLTLPTTPYV